MFAERITDIVAELAAAIAVTLFIGTLLIWAQILGGC